MPAQKPRLLRGTLDLLILKALSTGPLHGVGVSTRIRQMTGGSFSVSFGSLFPALHRIEEKRWIEAEWKTSDRKRRAKYYSLTAAGRRQLSAKQKNWERTVRIMDLALRSG